MCQLILVYYSQIIIHYPTLMLPSLSNATNICFKISLVVHFLNYNSIISMRIILNFLSSCGLKLF